MDHDVCRVAQKLSHCETGAIYCTW